MSKKDPHTVQRFPLSRQFTFDIGKLGRNKHHIKALIEVDVTNSRKKLKQKRRQEGTKISFTAWVLRCIAGALAEYPEVHAFRKGRGKRVLFHGGDISMAVEMKVEESLVPLLMVLRDADGKSIESIYKDIEKAKSAATEDGNRYVLDGETARLPAKFFALMPQALRLLIWKLLLADPFRVKRLMGTCMVTFVGMMGKVSGWFIPSAFIQSPSPWDLW